MGCGTSRMEPGEDIPSGLLPFMRRIHDLKRTRTDDSTGRRRERKDSIMSTTELLRPEERDIDDYDTAATEGSGEKGEHNGKGSETSHLSAMAKEKAEHGEEERRRIEFGRGRREGPAAEEEMPGSPSFRIYFADAVEGPNDNASIQAKEEGASKHIEEKKLLEEKEGHNDCLVMGEGSEFKTIRKEKEKGRKFIALPKANFLNVRGCYNTNSSSSLNAQEGTRILSEKAT